MADEKFEILDGFVSRSSSNVDGTLTSTQLVITGNVAVDTDTFIVNSANDRVGINRVPASGYSLDVSGTARATSFSGNGALLTSLDVANIPDLADSFLSSKNADSYESGGILSIANSSTLQVTAGSIKLSDDQTLVFGNGGDAILDFDATNNRFLISANSVETRITGETIISRDRTPGLLGGTETAIGKGAGLNQDAYGIAIGTDAQATNGGFSAIAIGANAGRTSQNTYTVAIGHDSGRISQKYGSVAVGYNSAYTGQGNNSVALGRNAAYENQNNYSVAIGYFAGANVQSGSSIAVGSYAGEDRQSIRSVALGSSAGRYTQKEDAVAVGFKAGTSNQGYYAVALGANSGATNQSNVAVAVGYQAGETEQGYRAIGIGQYAGRTNQNNYSIAIGYDAGQNNQREGSIAIGRNAGYINQGANSIHISSKATNDVITTNNHIWISSPDASFKFTTNDQEQWIVEGSQWSNSGMHYQRFLGSNTYQQNIHSVFTIYRSSNVGATYINGPLDADLLTLKTHVSNNSASAYDQANAELIFSNDNGEWQITGRTDDPNLFADHSVKIRAESWYNNPNHWAYMKVGDYAGSTSAYISAPSGTTISAKAAGGTMTTDLEIGGYTGIGGAASYGPMYLEQITNALSPAPSTYRIWSNAPDLGTNWIRTSPLANLHFGAYDSYNSWDYTWYNYRSALKIVPNPSGNYTLNTYAVLEYASSARLTTTSAGVTISGSLSKSSGSFKIAHPLLSKRDTHELVHSFVEAPQADNIYRGKVTLENGSASVNIDTVAGMTEGTFAALNREIQCFTTNETGWTAIKGSVTDNILTIEAQDSNCTDTVSWLVIGERQDEHMYDTEWTDENGKVIVEPLINTSNNPPEEAEE